MQSIRSWCAAGGCWSWAPVQALLGARQRRWELRLSPSPTCSLSWLSLLATYRFVNGRLLDQRACLCLSAQIRHVPTAAVWFVSHVALVQANGLSHIASAVPLPWGQPLPPPEQLPGQSFDLVLASDVLYLADALPLFISTLSEVFSANPEALLVLCNEHRPALPFPGALFAAAGLSVCRVPTAEQHPDWRSDDIHLYHIQLANLQASQRPARGSGTGSP